ncbi:MAG: sulfotransferase domain-containing protein [Actinobacteria bacterium]|nr:sulfotransferase domain-containing protein [Actinomycetota bacterium]
MTALTERANAALPEGLKARVKRGLRAYGVATAGVRSLPDFLVIGAKRGGTTSLYRNLVGHPDVLPLMPSRERIKGPHYFDTRYHLGHDWYRSHFPTVVERRGREVVSGRRVVTGESSPYYLFHPHAARRAHALVPSGKVVVLLRNPVDRAYSHWKERTHHGVETLGFEAAIDAEPERLRGERERLLVDETYYSFAHEHFSYLAQGLYLEPLLAWLRRYPREQVLVVASEELYADLRAVLDRVTAFLGLAPHPFARTRHWNHQPAEPIAPATRARLTARVAEPNRRLAACLDLDLPWAS